MVPAIALGLLFLGGGGVSARALWRSRWEPASGRSRKVVQGVARTLVLGAFGALFVVVAFDVQSSIVIAGVSLLLLGGLLTWAVCDGIERFICRHAAESLRGAVQEVARGSSAVWRARWRRAAAVVVPRDWSEIDLRRLAPDALLSFRSVLSAYALGVLLLPILALLAMVALVQYGGETTDLAAISAWTSFNALLVASCLALTAMVTVLLVAVLHLVRVVRIRVAYGSALATLASVIGVGSALGALTGALLPAMATAPYLGEMFPVAAVAELTSSTILLELSAGGAVLGFAVGIVAAINDLFSTAENFVLRRIAVPTVFLGLLAAAPAAGLSPRQVAERILAVSQSIHGGTAVDCEAPIPGELLADQGRLLVAIDQCGGLELMPDRWVLGTACAICVFMIVRGARRDVREAVPAGD